MIAVEEGIVSLDEPAGPVGSTVRHLLAHASGLPFLGTNGTETAPGTLRAYSNVGFNVLRALLEDRAQMSVADYLYLGVFEPLQMDATVLPVGGSVAKDIFSNVNDLLAFARELLSPTLIAPSTFAEFVSPQFTDLAGVLPGFGLQRP